jgi:AcrR family transcriptional regulator
VTEPAALPARSDDGARGKTETRLRLLEAAATVIARDGYERASLADIARTAGLSTGAVYSTFGSKWGLMRAVIAQRIRPLALPLQSATPHTDQSLSELAAGLARTIDSPGARQVAILQLEIILLALRNPELLDELNVDDRANHARLTDQLIVGGAELPLPAGQLATVLIGAVQGLQLSQLLDPADISDSLYAAALRLLLGRAPTGDPS